VAKWPLGPSSISRMWDVQEEGKKPWEIVANEARRAGESKIWSATWQREGMLRGAEDGDKRPRSRESGFRKGYGSTGLLEGNTAEEREEDWCELVWFSTNSGRDVGLKGE